MTGAEQLASFVTHAFYENLSKQARLQLKIRVLDSLGCALGVLAGEPVRLLRQQTQDFGGERLCTLIGGGRTAPDRAAPQFLHQNRPSAGRAALSRRRGAGIGRRPATAPGTCPHTAACLTAWRCAARRRSAETAARRW
jgi:hypothetical protein